MVAERSRFGGVCASPAAKTCSWIGSLLARDKRHVVSCRWPSRIRFTLSTLVNLARTLESRDKAMNQS